MKQLTDTEKQQLDAKIKEEQKRQQALRESNPDLPESFKVASAKTQGMKGLVPKHLWKYVFLVGILSLVVCNGVLFFYGRDSGSAKIFNLNLMVALMLLFNHIAFSFTKTGWKSRVMKIVAWVWMVLVFVYMYISWVA
ncbi:hypothetical protein J5I95_21385 [Candidatus Poribacteria bacterium]|nr:hypothetical protein [Candidatus Poribacteria bacterium]